MNITVFVIVFSFIAFDFLTGWVKALSTATVNSSIMRKGLYNKLGEVLAMLFGYGCEYFLPQAGLDIRLPFAGAIATYIILMETASIIENLSVISPGLSEALGKLFDKSKLAYSEQGKHEVKKDEENKSANCN